MREFKNMRLYETKEEVREVLKDNDKIMELNIHPIVKDLLLNADKEKLMKNVDLHMKKIADHSFYVGEFCKLAGIDEPIRETSYKGSERIDKISPKYELIGTHTGRRTFIVNGLSRGIAPNIMMKWTGHSSYSTMKPYIDIVDSIKAAEMEKMNFLD